MGGGGGYFVGSTIEGDKSGITKTFVFALCG